MEINDSLLIQAYTDMGNSVDKIAAFPKLRRDFLDRLAIQDHDGETIWRLLQLRKAGKLPKDLSRRN
jgi:hypothetical protein